MIYYRATTLLTAVLISFCVAFTLGVYVERQLWENKLDDIRSTSFELGYDAAIAIVEMEEE